MKHSEHIKFYRQLEAKGTATPLREIPYVTFSDSWYLDVFAVLSNSRAGGEVPGSIQISEMLTYSDHFEIIGNKKSFIEVIQSLDSIYLNHLSEKRKKDG